VALTLYRVQVKIERDEIRGYNEPDTIIPNLVGVSKDRLPQGIKALACVVNPSTGNTNVLVRDTCSCSGWQRYWM
jgi:hypothetical protein